MKKFAEKIVGVLTVLLLSPVIIIGLLCVAFCMFWDWLKEPSRKREYECSHYYKDFQIPYHKNITNEDGYRIYNEAKDRKLSVKMIHPSDGGSDYLIIHDSFFLFPMCPDVFGGIFYNTKKQHWEVDFDGEYYPLDEEWEKYKKPIADAEQGSPCYLLIKKSDVCPCRDGDNDDTEESGNDFAWDLLPPYVHVVEQYIDIISG